MRLYYFTAEEWAVDNLAKRRLKISNILELNDPYELLCIVTGDQVMKGQFLEYRDTIVKSRGLISFSTKWDNPIIWSHYADRHRGICLGFEVDERDTFAVTYTDDRISMMEEMRVHGDRKKLLQRILSTKHTPWAYEHEVRVFSEFNNEEAGLYFQPFNERLALREVILGVRCTAQLSTIAAFDEVVRSKAEVFDTTLSDSEFKVVRKN